MTANAAFAAALTTFLIVAWMAGHCSARNLPRSPCSSNVRAPAFTNMPRPRFFSTSCSVTS